MLLLDRKIKIYGASYFCHAAMWEGEFCQGHPSHEFVLISTWQHAALNGMPETPLNAAKFWVKAMQEISLCDALVFYADAGDKLDGCEVGAALILNKPVVLVAPDSAIDLSSWHYHPNVERAASINKGLIWLYNRRYTYAL